MSFHEVKVEGSRSSISQAPDPKGTPFEIAMTLLENAWYSLEDLPMTNKVTLIRNDWIKHTPPRCRKPREKQVETIVAEFTLGDFRKGEK